MKTERKSDLNTASRWSWWVLSAACLACVYLTTLAGCAGSEQRVVTGPLGAPPIARPSNLERVNSGSIFQPNMMDGSLFSGERRPRYVGDTLKIDISESISATNKVTMDTDKESKLAQKGPGSKAGLGLLSTILNLDATASGSNSFKGSGNSENSSKFTGQLAVSVINVFPNGNLVVAGDRTIAMNGGVSVLRFSGIISPKDIHAGNTASSSDAVNAKLEVVGKGDVSDAASRNWIQRVLAESLAFW